MRRRAVVSVQPPTPGSPPLPAPGSLRCPRCSATVGPDQDWCLECGAPARTRLAPTPNWQLPTVALAAVMLVAGALFAFAFVKLTSDDNVVTTPAATTTAAPVVAPPVVAPPVVAPPVVPPPVTPPATTGTTGTVPATTGTTPTTTGTIPATTGTTGQTTSTPGSTQTNPTATTKPQTTSTTP